MSPVSQLVRESALIARKHCETDCWPDDIAILGVNDRTCSKISDQGGSVELRWLSLRHELSLMGQV